MGITLYSTVTLTSQSLYIMFTLIFLTCLALSNAGSLGNRYSSNAAAYGSSNSAAANNGANYASSNSANQKYGAQSASDYGSSSAEKYGSSSLSSNKDHYSLDKTDETDKGNYYASASSSQNGANQAQYGANQANTQNRDTTNNAYGNQASLGPYGKVKNYAAYGSDDSIKYSSAVNANQYGSNGAYYAAADQSQSGNSYDRAKSTLSEVRDHEDLKTADSYGEKQAQNYGSNSASNYGSADYANANNGAQYGSYKNAAQNYGSSNSQYAQQYRPTYY